MNIYIYKQIYIYMHGKKDILHWTHPWSLHRELLQHLPYYSAIALALLQRVPHLRNLGLAWPVMGLSAQGLGFIKVSGSGFLVQGSASGIGFRVRGT